MNVPNAHLARGKKFYWDGKVYSSQSDAETAQAAYEQDGFEACTCRGEGPFSFLVYTRREVRQQTDEKLN